MFWLDSGGCDSSTTPSLSPYIFLHQTSWIDMRQGGFPPLVSQEPKFKISSQSNEEIQSYWPSNVGFECRHQWGRRYTVLYWNYILPNQYLSVFWPPFHPMHVYKPHISTPWSSFTPFSFREWERSLGVKTKTHFCEEKRI